jgi:O-antigen ligase
MMATAMSRFFDQARLTPLTDWLAIAVAVSMPWSTTASGILIALWLLALIPAIDWRALRAIVVTPAGGLPVLLVVLGAAGMLWADVSLAERWGGFSSFLKLLVIPLLFVQFRYSERALWVFGGYLASCVVLLAASTLVQFIPASHFVRMKPDYVLVKNAATQSGEFVTCIFGLLFLSVECFERRRWLWLFGIMAAILGMLANIVFVATGRTALVLLLVLLALFAMKRLRARGILVLTAVSVAVGAVGWFSSPYLRSRTEQAWTDYQKYEETDARNSSGERLEFWKKSIEFMREAPLIGHGTGSIHALFIASSVGKGGAAGSATTNPHNQTFAVAIQLGIVGAIVLWAMWIAHLLLFRGGGGLVEWIGLVVVAQNIVGSVFNSHLFDFVQGWVYVFGVGVAGGMALKRRSQKANAGGDGPSA